MSVLFFVAIALTFLAPAKASASPPQPRFGETIEVRLLEVDARVVDRDGNPVHGLGMDDFVLFEDGKRVELEGVLPNTSLQPSVWYAGDDSWRLSG